MTTETTRLKDLKKLRLERHWSQEQLADMSGLSIRTIQRIERGENAGLESLKALAAVFDTTIEDSKKEDLLEQAKKEEAYIQKVKGFYKLLGLAVINLILFLWIALADDDGEAWNLFFYMLVTWAIFLGLFAIYSFDLFGASWQQKLIDKKFGKRP